MFSFRSGGERQRVALARCLVNVTPGIDDCEVAAEPAILKPALDG